MEVLDNLAGFPATDQPLDGTTYAAKIAKTETRLDFTADALTVERQVRAFNPAPGAWFEYDGQRYRVLACDMVEQSGTAGTILDDHLTIACATGAIRPTVIQRAGKPAMPLKDFRRGNNIPIGTQL